MSRPARPPRVLVVGPIAGGTLDTARSTARGAEALGADTRLLDFGAFGAGWDVITKLDVSPDHKTRLKADYAKVLGEAIVATAASWRPDLVLALAQAPMNASVSSRLRAAGMRTALWFVENHRVLTYWKAVAKDYDAFFAIQDEPFLAMVREAGAGKAVYLPTACDPVRHAPVTLSDDDRARFGADVSFAGAPYRNRQRLLLGLIDMAPRIWGDGWQATELARLAAGGGARFTLDEMVKIFNATAVNLNIHSANHVEGLDPDGDYVNPRTFELAACGAFQLVDARAPLGALFAPGELVTFTSMAQLREQIPYFLARPAERAAIAARARQRAIGEHTFAHRVRRIFDETLPASVWEAGRTTAAPAADLDRAIDALARTATKMSPDEAMMRVLRHVRDGVL